MKSKLAPFNVLNLNLNLKFFSLIGSLAAVHLQSSVSLAQSMDPALCNPTGCLAKVETFIANQGSFYIGTTGTETNSKCTPESGVYFVLKSNHKNYDAIVAGVIANQIADKPVLFRIVDNSSPCEIAYVEFRK